jgi:hypothetical protein
MEMLRRVIQNLKARFQECIQMYGHYLADIIFQT